MRSIQQQGVSVAVRLACIYIYIYIQYLQTHTHTDRTMQHLCDRRIVVGIHREHSN